MLILSVDTSADETSAGVTNGRRVLSNEIYSQIILHQKYGGIMPSVAKRAHRERIDGVINRAIKKAGVSFDKIDYLAVTYSQGLAIALEVGVNKIKELSIAYHKKIIPVNHLEGHIYSCFAQNSAGKPDFKIKFPYLALVISGGHTGMYVLANHINYQLIGESIDDAVGEALDKAARMLIGAGYPGGPIIERLAKTGNAKYHHFPRPMRDSRDLNFSFSGLKTSMMYYLKSITEEDKLKHLADLAASYQQACFDSLLFKLEAAIKKTGINSVLVGGGVIANLTLRQQIRQLIKKYNGTVLFPKSKLLIGDNAAMIGVVAYYKGKKGIIVNNINGFDRIARENLDEISVK